MVPLAAWQLALRENRCTKVNNNLISEDIAGGDGDGFPFSDYYRGWWGQTDRSGALSTVRVRTILTSCDLFWGMWGPSTQWRVHGAAGADKITAV